MDKIVSADTIREITQRNRSNDLVGPPPSVATIKERVVKTLQDIINKYQQEINRGDSNKKHDGKFNRAKRQLKSFKKAINDIPSEFNLELVLYSRISKEDNRKTQHEFSSRVKPRFITFLAKNFEEDLKKLGICEHGLERMRHGLDPADENGRYYDLSVDHIIERSGSGKLGLEKAVDPLMPKGSKPTYKVNHFSNLILMSHTVHDNIKNAINVPQSLPDLKAGESKWAIMAVPKRDKNNPQFVHVVTPGQQKEYGMGYRKFTPSQSVSHAVYVTKQARLEVKEFLDHPMVCMAIRTLQEIAKNEGTSLDTLLIDQEVHNKKSMAQNKLSRIFQDIIKYDTDVWKSYKNRILPLIQDMVDNWEHAYNKVTAPGVKLSYRKAFLQSYDRKNFKVLKKRISMVPIEGMGSMIHRLDELDKRIEKDSLAIVLDVEKHRPPNNKGFNNG